MAEATEEAREPSIDGPGRHVLVPTAVENLNSTARAHGLSVSAARIVREDELLGYNTKEKTKHLVIDWRGTGSQLRSLGWILPSWSFPVATARGPGCKRLEMKWGIGGYVHVPVDESDIRFEIDFGDVPLSISKSDGVETVSYGWCSEYHGTQAALVAAGIAKAGTLGGKRGSKSGRYSDKRRWWRSLQPDGTIVFVIESDLSRRRREKESERIVQESQRHSESEVLDSQPSKLRLVVDNTCRATDGSNILPFRDPDAPLLGLERLAARRIFRAGCKAIAARAVAQLFSEACKVRGTEGLGTQEALPLFVAAMRRELRKSGLF